MELETSPWFPSPWETAIESTDNQVDCHITDSCSEKLASTASRSSPMSDEKLCPSPAEFGLPEEGQPARGQPLPLDLASGEHSQAEKVLAYNSAIQTFRLEKQAIEIDRLQRLIEDVASDVFRTDRRLSNLIDVDNDLVNANVRVETRVRRLESAVLAWNTQGIDNINEDGLHSALRQAPPGFSGASSTFSASTGRSGMMPSQYSTSGLTCSGQDPQPSSAPSLKRGISSILEDGASTQAGDLKRPAREAQVSALRPYALPMRPMKDVQQRETEPVNPSLTHETLYKCTDETMQRLLSLRYASMYKVSNSFCNVFNSSALTSAAIEAEKRRSQCLGSNTQLDLFLNSVTGIKTITVLGKNSTKSVNLPLNLTINIRKTEVLIREHIKGSGRKSSDAILVKLTSKKDAADLHGCLYVAPKGAVKGFLIESSNFTAPSLPLPSAALHGMPRFEGKLQQQPATVPNATGFAPIMNPDRERLLARTSTGGADSDDDQDEQAAVHPIPAGTSANAIPLGGPSKVRAGGIARRVPSSEAAANFLAELSTEISDQPAANLLVKPPPTLSTNQVPNAPADLPAKVVANSQTKILADRPGDSPALLLEITEDAPDQKPQYRPSVYGPPAAKYWPAGTHPQSAEAEVKTEGKEKDVVIRGRGEVRF